VRSLIDPARLAAYDAEERRVADQPDDGKRKYGPASDWYCYLPWNPTPNPITTLTL
jgi:hypothetical protein